MRPRLMVAFIFIFLFLVVDYYFFQAIITLTGDFSVKAKSVIRYGFWIPTGLSIIALLWWAFADPYKYSASVRQLVLSGLFVIYFSKLFGIIVLFVDDLQRGVRWVASLFSKKEGNLPGEVIPRSEFLAKTALVASAIPLGAFTYGIISGAHDYHLKRVTVKLPNLPKAFDGIKIGQISDIHSGSFWNKTAVKGGVELLQKEKPDVIFFTGDLVNTKSDEVQPYMDIFNKLRAPLGVFSITGNHDYGDYGSWPSIQEKQKNFKNLIEAHRLLGFDLLLNEHRFLEQGGEKLAILGIENWGAGRFSKYGKMDLAYRGTEDASTKLLLSHDPSHWDAQVRQEYPDIDMAFAGHTHGFQFGVEIGNFKWSPSQYIYKQWAGLYQEGNQYLYVNRGFGYLGYPGRVGIPPELTIVELKRA
ncbi:MAG TPA: metallophosphoesterase [Cyclobacteriaceae bacterium]|nr:metallophosphoesterase [Cyclobacteriaceae bacterium]